VPDARATVRLHGRARSRPASSRSARTSPPARLRHLHRELVRDLPLAVLRKALTSDAPRLARGFAARNDPHADAVVRGPSSVTSSSSGGFGTSRAPRRWRGPPPSPPGKIRRSSRPVAAPPRAAGSCGRHVVVAAGHGGRPAREQPEHDAHVSLGNRSDRADLTRLPSAASPAASGHAAPAAGIPAPTGCSMAATSSRRAAWARRRH
jgi:hypothetical protein